MSSTFWFLLEFTVLLALAAGVFAWLGWMWRGSERGDRVKKLEDELEEQRRLARAAMDERDAARAEASSGSVHVSAKPSHSVRTTARPSIRVAGSGHSSHSSSSRSHHR